MSELNGAIIINGVPHCEKCRRDITEDGQVRLVRLWDEENKSGCDYVCKCGQIINQTEAVENVH